MALPTASTNGVDQLRLSSHGPLGRVLIDLRLRRFHAICKAMHRAAQGVIKCDLLTAFVAYSMRGRNRLSDAAHRRRASLRNCFGKTCRPCKSGRGPSVDRASLDAARRMRAHRAWGMVRVWRLPEQAVQGYPARDLPPCFGPRLRAGFLGPAAWSAVPHRSRHARVDDRAVFAASAGRATLLRALAVS
jgi:hypothetical protein